MQAFGRLHDGFRQGGMGVNGQAHIGCVGAHLDRQNTLGDELTGANTGDADPQYSFGPRVDHQFGQTVGAPGWRLFRMPPTGNG